MNPGLSTTSKKPDGAVPRSVKQGNTLKLLNKNKYLLMMFLPTLLFFVIFCYLPMYGLVISFQDYIPGNGFLEGPWVGFKHFTAFFDSIFFWRLIKNTFLLGLYTTLFSFPFAIIFAVFLMQVRRARAKKIVQTVSYIPHFMSLVVVIGMTYNMLSPSGGVINTIISNLGGQPIDFFNDSSWFRPIYIITEIWQSFGWDAIIYISAISGISLSLYEAADIDGVTSFQKIIHITIPQILPTVMIMLVLRLGNIMSVGYEKIILMYNPSIYDVSDVISTYTYRRGILNNELSFASAVGFFNSIINFLFLLGANKFSRKLTGNSLW